MRKKTVFTVFSLFFLSGVSNSAPAQSPEKRAWGYVFIGPGGSSGGGNTFLHAGGGGEGLLYKGFGAGAEIGAFIPVSQDGNTVGIASVNLSGHFNRSGKVVPFFTGGASLAFRSGAAGGGNFGGGVQWWVKDRLGLRFEFRDHIFSSDNPHVYSFRVGLSFR